MFFVRSLADVARHLLFHGGEALGVIFENSKMNSIGSNFQFWRGRREEVRQEREVDMETMILRYFTRPCVFLRGFT